MSTHQIDAAYDPAAARPLDREGCRANLCRNVDRVEALADQFDGKLRELIRLARDVRALSYEVAGDLRLLGLDAPAPAVPVPADIATEGGRPSPVSEPEPARPGPVPRPAGAGQGVAP